MICSIGGCGRPRRGRGYCQVHYMAYWRYGDPLVEKARPTSLPEEEYLSWYGWDVTESGCWEFKGPRDAAGYGRTARESGDYLAHRMSYTQNIGPIPDELHVLHSCDNPPCINPDHLRVGSHQENMQDKVGRGRVRPKRLSENEKKEILRLRKEGATAKEIAVEFGVSPNTVFDVARRERTKKDA